MKWIAVTLSLAATPAYTQAEPKRWAQYDKGIKWEDSFSDALERAKTEKKPILFFQLAGDLDLEGC